MDADNSILAFNKLCQNVPAIGFLSRKKRIQAYIAVTNLAQELHDSGEISEEEALFVLSLMMRKHKNFQKAASIVSLNLASLGPRPFKPLGFQFANQMRANLKLSPVDDTTRIEI